MSNVNIFIELTKELHEGFSKKNSEALPKIASGIKPWTYEEEGLLIELYKQMTLKEAAWKLGRCMGSANNKLYELRVKKDPRLKPKIKLSIALPKPIKVPISKAVDKVLSLAKAVRSGSNPARLKHRQAHPISTSVRVYKSPALKERVKFLEKYSKDIYAMSSSWLKKYKLDIDIWDVIQEVRLKVLSSKTWYDDMHVSGAKETTFLFIVIKHVVIGLRRDLSKEVLWSDLKEDPWKITNEEIEALHNAESYEDDIKNIQKTLKDKKPLLSYIFYGYLLGYINSEIAQKLRVTEAHIGCVWNAFIKSYRRMQCRVVPFFSH